MRFVFILFLCSVSSIGIAQNNALFQKWIPIRQGDCFSDKSRINVPGYNMGSWLTMEFTTDNKVAIKQVNKETIDVFQTFKISNNTLLLDFSHNEIQKITSDSLILIQKTFNSNCTKIVYLSEKYIEANQHANFKINGIDTVYTPTVINGPKLRNEEYISNLLLEFIPLQNQKRTNCSMIFNFILTKEGKIIDLNLDVVCDKSSKQEIQKKRIFKALTDKRNKWTPMTIDGHPVNTFIELPFLFTF